MGKYALSSLIFVLAIADSFRVPDGGGGGERVLEEGLGGVRYSNVPMEDMRNEAPFTDQPSDDSAQSHPPSTNGSDPDSLMRLVADLRISMCRWLQYEGRLPTASIIIPFFNEQWEVLLRTLHSVASRSPRDLVREVILVDDMSSDARLGPALDEYVSQHFHNVTVLRADKRLGSIKARLLGARAASGSVLVFLVSHCEVGVNWLPPLLQPIKHNYKTVTCPLRDTLDNRTFSLLHQDAGARHAFDWHLNGTRLPRLQADQERPERPFDSPVMAGETFAISRRWFWELGGYDSGLVLWGGEQYELSFKIWMCGGTMVNVPCARLALVLRPPVPVPETLVTRNYKRIAEVWMGEWKKFLYHEQLEKYSAVTCGNLTLQRRLRDRLRCRSFNWFMEKVAFDILRMHPPRRISEFFACRIIATLDGGLCVDARFQTAGGAVRVGRCASTDTLAEGREQRFHISMGLDIRPGRRDVCFEVPENETGLVLGACVDSSPDQSWQFNFETGQLVHGASEMCLHLDPQQMGLSVHRCSSNILQKWRIDCENEGVAASDGRNMLDTSDLTDMLIEKKRKYLASHFLDTPAPGDHDMLGDAESAAVLTRGSDDRSSDTDTRARPLASPTAEGDRNRLPPTGDQQAAGETDTVAGKRGGVMQETMGANGPPMEKASTNANIAKTGQGKEMSWLHDLLNQVHMPLDHRGA